MTLAIVLYLGIGFLISMAWFYTGVVLNQAMSMYTIPWRSINLWIDVIGMVVMITLFWFFLVIWATFSKEK